MLFFYMNIIPQRLWASVRVFFALWVGAVLLICNFGAWYSDEICTRTQFKAHTTPHTPQQIQATVGISIALRGFNVTLLEHDCGGMFVLLITLVLFVVHLSMCFVK